MSGAGSEERVRVLSDLHLGHPAARIKAVEQLRPLLKGVNEVIFNGDTFEQAVKEWKDRGHEQFAELKALCVELGVTASFLAGNHDLWLEGDRWRDLRGGKVFVTHGDMILPEVAPWNREFLARRDEVGRIIEEFGPDVDDLRRLQERALRVEEATLPDRDPQIGEGGRDFFRAALWPPRRPFNMLKCWATMFREANRFAERYRPDCEVFLFGHFHRSGFRQRDGRILCNTGAFMKGARPLCVDLVEDRMEVREIEQRDGVLRPSSLGGSFRLAGPDAGA